MKWTAFSPIGSLSNGIFLGTKTVYNLLPCFHCSSGVTVLFRPGKLLILEFKLRHREMRKWLILADNNGSGSTLDLLDKCKLVTVIKHIHPLKSQNQSSASSQQYNIRFKNIISFF